MDGLSSLESSYEVKRKIENMHFYSIFKYSSRLYIF